MVNKFDAVLFDMDGTVLNTIDDIHDAVNHTLAAYGLPTVTLQRVIDAIGNGARELIAGCLDRGEATPDFDAIVPDYQAYYRAHSVIKTAPYAGILPLLDELKARGVKVAIVSNKTHLTVLKLAEQFFPGVFAIGNQEGIACKPAPDMIYHTLQLLGVEKDRAVYVGDSEVDVWTTQNAAMRLAAVSYGFRSKERLAAEGATTICDSVAELQKFLLDK